MINRVFFITENLCHQDWNKLAGENIFFSIRIRPEQKTLKDLYNSIENYPVYSFCLSLEVDRLMEIETLRSTTSFLFMPSYLRIQGMRIINISGSSSALIDEVCSSITEYFSLQGINDIIINKLNLNADHNLPGKYRPFDSLDMFMAFYRQLLQSDQYFNNDIFFRASSIDILNSALLSLKELEIEFERKFPHLYSLSTKYMLLEKEYGSLKQKNICTAIELNYQKQQNDILRSVHSTTELQKFYDHEYEILPVWYKRFGHIIKVLMGKRTFRSLFSDQGKKYKD